MILVGVAWAAHLLLFLVARPAYLEMLPTIRYGALVPSRVFEHYEAWRVFTYALMDVPLGLDSLWAVLSLWFFATPIEQRAGAKALAWTFGLATLGGAVAVLLVSRFSMDFHSTAAIGLAPILSSALLVRWGFVVARERVSFFGMAEMQGKILAGALCGIVIARALWERTPINIAEVGGMLAVFGVTGMRSGRGGSRKVGAKKSKSESSGKFTVIRGGRSDADDKKWIN